MANSKAVVEEWDRHLRKSESWEDLVTADYVHQGPDGTPKGFDAGSRWAIV